MRNFLSIILFFTFLTITKGQDTTYISHGGLKVEKKVAKQYFVIHKSNQYFRKDSYSVDNLLKSSVHYLDEEKKIMNGKAVYYYSSGKTSSEGYYNNNKRDSVWLFYYENGSLSAKIRFQEGEIIDIYKSVSEDGKKLDGFPNDRKPAFPGGTDALINYLSKEIKFPRKSRKKGIEGKVVVGFTIDKSGSIKECHIAKSVNEELDLEALRVVTKMPKWIPGIQFNRHVNVKYLIPINFKL